MTGLEIIKHFEGLRLRAYLCPAGIPTIGWGHTKGVSLGDVCTPEQAEAWIQGDYDLARRIVLRHVESKLTENQIQALTSWVFNLGEGNFTVSTLLKKLNNNDIEGASKEILKWNKGRVNGSLVVLPGLDRRRIMEKQLFDTP